MISEQDIRDQLKRITYPGSNRDILTLGLVGEILTKDGTIIIHLRPSSATEEVLHHLTGRITSALSAVPGVQKVTIHGGHPRGATAQPPPVAAPALTPLPGVRRVIAVASGKGGVGKSTVAVNLALALKALGNRVGLLDADVYGPSVPLMMGTEATPRAGQDKKIYPVEKYGISLISMGFFLDDQSPVIWRGPIVMGIVRQFLRDVLWGELDYLIVDLPPGTGDAALTLAQEVPLSGGVIVSTPQDVALLDVQRGIAMFRQVNVPILGIIENMSYYVCPHCGEREEIFGHGGVQKTELEVLGEVPLVEEIRTGGDLGKPVVVQHPGHPVAQVFRQIAQRVMETEALRRAQR
jgi:ATP-binding protein involved in chromosome partitioning